MIPWQQKSGPLVKVFVFAHDMEIAEDGDSTNPNTKLEMTIFITPRG